jgi:hypothetical protein
LLWRDSWYTCLAKALHTTLGSFGQPSKQAMRADASPEIINSSLVRNAMTKLNDAMI